MTQFPDDRGAEMRDLFFETSQELLQALNDDALKLEKSPRDGEIVRSIRRTVHTLKGDSAACGFKELSELAHKLEDALAVDITTSPVSLVELTLLAADVFAEMINAYRKHKPLPDATGLQRMVRELASTAPSQTKQVPSAPAVTWTEYEQKAADAARTGDTRVFHVVAHVDRLCAMPIAARQLVATALASIGQVLAARPEGFSENAKKLDLLIATNAPETVIVSKCLIPTVIARVEYFEMNAPGGEAGGSKQAPSVGEASLAEHPHHPAESQPSPESRAPESHAPTAAPSTENILRVDAERIDNVLNLVGELIIAKSMLQQAMQEFVRRYPKDQLRLRFADAMGFQSRVMNDLQRSVMKIRMVPVEQLFRRFPRIVRDTAKRCGKEVEFVISGQETDVDKGLLDAIAEPLTHIIRNSVSHGIESPAERKAAGKSAKGAIHLHAYHQANHLIIEIKDDGCGIDAAKLKLKAIGTKLITPEEADRMSPQEAFDLIFRPGFSTAHEITEISGRGVGLDVVRSVLAKMKGTVEVETELGKSTIFRLKLPLTLAIIQALLFRIENRLYAIPLNSVAEIARAHEADLHRVDSTEVLQLRNQILPLVRVAPRRISELGSGKEKIFVLVLTFGERKLGLIVDSLEGEEELVTKALDDQTVSTDLVSSASILGDGRVVLIMNLAAVMERFTRNGTEIRRSQVFTDLQQPTRQREARQ
ncbi:MAG TPA: chemotaxis protein CheA [Terriglobales bacterium]|nr:chemotaxis protein CheA [Terriglobales bacterium]